MVIGHSIRSKFFHSEIKQSAKVTAQGDGKEITEQTEITE